MLEKLKELSKETAIYGVSTIVGRFLSFLLVPFYTHVFTTVEFGIYSYIYVIIAFLNIAYIYGMDAAFLKYSSLAEGEEKKDIFSTPFIFVTLTSLVYSAILYFLKEPFGSAIDLGRDYFYLINYMVFILVFDTLTLVPFANLRLEKKATKFASIKIINIVTNLVLNIILILVFDLGIEAIFLSNLLASVLTFLILLPEIIKNLKFRISKIWLNKMLRFGLPYLPASISAMMLQVIDVPILRELTDYDTVGLYRANYKLGIFMMLFVSMFQYAWQPFFLTNAKETNAKEIFSKVLTLFILVSSFIWVFLSLFIEDIVKINFFGRTIIEQGYWEGLFIVPIILLAYLFYGIHVNFTAGIYIEEKTKYLPFVTGLGAAVNIVVNYVLIPVYGIMGAALATLISYFVLTIGLFFVSQKFYKINYEYSVIFRIFFACIILGSIYYYLYTNDQVNFFIKLIFLVGFLVMLYLFRVFKTSELKSIIRLGIKNKSE